MTPETLQAVVAGVVGGVVAGVGGVCIVALWLKKTFMALEQVPKLTTAVEDLEASIADLQDALNKAVNDARTDLGVQITEAQRTAKAAHGRIDNHSERLAKLEARSDAHDRESERTQLDIGKRLDRIETKLDQVIRDGRSA